jgi:hypothetical protein
LIAVFVRDLRSRLLLLLLVAFVLYLLEPGFHQHEDFTADAVALGPLGVSAALAHLAGLSMLVLLAGFVSSDCREGYTRLYFSHPTSPLAYYGLRWALAYAISFGAATLFLVLGQLLAWGRILGGWQGLVLPALAALVYGGLLAFFSTILPRGDAWLVFLLFLPTFFPEMLTLALSGASPTVRQLVLLLLPPQSAIAEVWEGLLLGSFAWVPAAWAAGYGALFLLAAAAILKLREWP